MKIDRDILQILVNRDIKTKKKIKKFLESDKSNIADPFLMEDVQKSVNRIKKAIKNNENIWIFGDYDVDGVTSTSVFILALRKLNTEVNFYIPLRDEGYGPNKKAIQEIKDKKGDLIITVDCGISSIEEIDFANQLGLDVIITDHHEINNELPNAHAIVNPKREENKYHFKNLAGVGTIFMVLLALFEDLGKKEEIFELLDIVALGTIADIVPLLEENRIFVKEGLEIIQKPKNIGLKTLFNFIFKDKQDDINTGNIGYNVGPIFNAAGRLKDAKKGVELLITPSATEAKAISKILIKQNAKRKDIEEKIFKRADRYILDNKLDQRKVIIAGDESFHHGVNGIVASKITEKYYKPSVILKLKDDGTAVASARSIEGFNIIEAINDSKELLLKYGGHPAAAGFSIKSENIEKFEKEINKYADKHLSEEDLIKPIKIDGAIPISKVSFDFNKRLKQLAPFGMKNPKPTFKIHGVNISRVRKIGRDKTHLMFDVSKNNIDIKNCVWFQKAEEYNDLKQNMLFDVAFRIQMDSYKDKYYTKLFVKDIRKHIPVKISRIKKYFDLYNTPFPIETVFYSNLEVKKDDDLEIDFNTKYENLSVIKNKSIRGFLDSSTSFLLKQLHENYNFKFNLNIKKVEKTSTHNNIFVEITRDFDFKTYEYSKKGLFNAIKRFLIGKFEYNSLQKEVLGSIFHKKQKTLLISQKERGVNTIILTIGIFYLNLQKKKCNLITKENVPEIFKKYFNVSDKRPNSDYTIFYNNIPEEEDLNKKTFIFSEKDISIEGFNKIRDNLEIPDNITILDENILSNSEYDDEAVYSKKMPLDIKKDIINNINKYSKIFSTKDILAIL
ncbi:MAG: single-stranded-DNA-specific exonuclease RecJ, partial [Fusobacteriota bacterium]